MHLSHENLKMLTLASSITKDEGIKGFYKGFNSLLAGNILSYGSYFYFYEFLKI